MIDQKKANKTTYIQREVNSLMFLQSYNILLLLIIITINFALW